MNRQRIAAFLVTIAIAMGAPHPAGASEGAMYSPISSHLSFLSWVADSYAADYAVFVNGARVAADMSVPRNFIEAGRVEAAVSALLGPADVVEVATVDSSGKAGARIRAEYSARAYVFVPEFNLLFEKNRTSLDVGALAKLRSFAQLVERHGFTQTIAVGHDAGPVGAKNAYRIGQLRASAVATSLGRLVGVPTATSSWGNGSPIESNATALGRAINRRVELGLR